jgi:hypothetical protein
MTTLADPITETVAAETDAPPADDPMETPV